MPKPTPESTLSAIIRHQLTSYKVDNDVLQAILPEDVYNDWMVLCQAIDAKPLLMIEVKNRTVIGSYKTVKYYYLNFFNYR